jgi:hypothetical protein
MPLRPTPIALLLALGACAAPGPPVSGPEDPDGGGAVAGPGPLALLEMEADDNQLPIVRGTIDGRPARLLIDTGASATIVSASLLGVAPDQGVRVQSLCLGPVCWSQLGVWAADTPFSRPEPGAIQAVVGMNPLGQLVLDLDHGRTLALWAVAPDCGTAALPLRFDDEGRPLLEARLDEQPLGPVLLDTGSRYSLLDADSAAAAGYLDEAATETGACSIAGCSSGGSFVSVARQFCGGPRCLSDVEVKYPAWNAIGGSFLRRVRMVLDLPGATVRMCD